MAGFGDRLFVRQMSSGDIYALVNGAWGRSAGPLRFLVGTETAVFGLDDATTGEG